MHGHPARQAGLDTAGRICYRAGMTTAAAERRGAQATPMFQQYWQIKAQYPDPDTILFFHVGDFYEMFFDDATVAARILDITLTTRNPNDPEPIPLCGVPIHSADGYVAALLAAGKKVALCEQVEDPKTAKGVVRREVVRVLTPGAVLDGEGLQAREPHFLAAVHEQDHRWGLAVLDLSTGDFRATELRSRQALRDELDRLAPREVLVTAAQTESIPTHHTHTIIEATLFRADTLPALPGREALGAAALACAGAVWEYLRFTKWQGPRLHEHLAQLQAYHPTDYLILDEATRRNLELLRTMHDGQRTGSLLWHLDRTQTAMGARQLRHWLLYPLRHLTAIEARLEAIAALHSDLPMQESLAATLQGMHDLERLAGRIATGHATPRDLVALRHSLEALPALRTRLTGQTGLLGEQATQLDPCTDVATQIAQWLVDAPPLSAGDGGLIRDGADPELDELRTIQREGKGYIARLEAEERQRTGIGSLKIRYNRVFGYYLEITHAHRDRVPADYIRKQTLTNAERYITPALKSYEEKVVSAEERANALEYAHFVRLRESLGAALSRIKRSAAAVATIDVLLSLTRVAQEGDYCRPTLVDTPTLEIQDGRHPIIERLLTNERFVPNDCRLDGAASPRLLIITGPNMAGKSTVMRQVGLITLLAHLGSFVPARRAVIGLTDRIFTRVGAGDNLARGQSTFMVEMAEAATILGEATPQSLILIDELGRGTSTYDGISIAWAVAEFLHDHTQARTLFATHYHELAELAQTRPGIANMTMAVKEWNDRIIFLRTLVPGAADRSYGIEVARLAGLPPEVTTRARAILHDLESTPDRDHHTTATPTPTPQLTLFTTTTEHDSALHHRLRTLDLNTLTPLEAMNILAELTTLARQSGGCS